MARKEGVEEVAQNITIRGGEKKGYLGNDYIDIEALFPCSPSQKMQKPKSTDILLDKILFSGKVRNV